MEIIAEIGINHGGDASRARYMIDGVAEAKADTVKFQTYTVSEFVRKHTPKADFQQNDSSLDHYSMLEKCELSLESLNNLKKYAEKKGLNFLSTPYHPSAVYQLEAFGTERFKIASADLHDKFLIDAVIETGKPIIFSTGMATFQQVSDIKNYIETKGVNLDHVVFLHCTSEYPCSEENANLRFINNLIELGVNVGFSDHSIGSTQALVALGLGANTFEKHVTFDTSASGPDHSASADLEEFSRYVSALRSGFKSLGNRNKTISLAEENMQTTSRKTLVYREDMDANSRVHNSSFCAMRPFDGMSTFSVNELIGRKLKKAVKAMETVVIDDFES